MGVPYYDYGIIDPETLFELLRPLHNGVGSSRFEELQAVFYWFPKPEARSPDMHVVLLQAHLERLGESSRRRVFAECDVLGGSWVVISRVICRVALVITHIRGLITRLIPTQKPASRELELPKSIRRCGCCDVVFNGNEGGKRFMPAQVERSSQKLSKILRRYATLPAYMRSVGR